MAKMAALCCRCHLLQLSAAYRHMTMHMLRDAMLPFAEKAGNGRPKNEPLWQPKIVYPITQSSLCK